METGKVLLIAGGAYVLYSLFLAPASTAAAASATPLTSATGATGATAVPSGPILTSAQQNLLNVVNALGSQGPNLLLTAGRVTANQQYSVSQWNYYLNQLTSQQIGPDLTGYVPNAATGTTTAAQYWAALQSYASGQPPTYGLSGLGCGPNDLVSLAGLSYGQQPGRGVSTRVPVDPQATGRFEVGGKDEWSWG